MITVMIDVMVSSSQVLRAGLPAEPSPLIFASPTKLVSETATGHAEYLGANRVPALQKLFQVRL